MVDFYSSFSPVFTFDTSETVEVCSDGPFTTRALMPDIDDKVLQNITETLTAHMLNDGLLQNFHAKQFCFWMV